MLGSCDCTQLQCGAGEDALFPNLGPQQNAAGSFAEDSVCYNCRIGNYYT